MRNVNLFSHNRHSESGKALALSLGVKRLRHTNSRYVPSVRKVVINWGASNDRIAALIGSAAWVINHPDNVETAQDKVRCFEKLYAESVNIPDFTTDKGIAQEWLDSGDSVVCRALTRASAGRGITIVRPAPTPDELGEFEEAVTQEPLPNVPLYVKYIKKQDEYRVHIVQNRAIDVAQKRRNTDVADADVNWKIRTHDNGFVYCREDLEVPDSVKEEALKAVEAVGLSFGAVDVIYNRHRGQAYVLEINTAPGLTGTTLERYTEALKELIEDVQRAM
jgi:glutathione synthase/RimK-type ligase-like ATP-grasp enzyme